ncbi:helix-turn-helix domain-containing protein [Streptomyces hoynatensis]|uniref:AraC-like ligand-binding domain-containing protein n=1 Tax=Streptomyces hoynatensis TaxID=1141874 RepID=UPI001575D350|nr:helix-turn-helix domain-containing protein [Streptomyces hoynatensis]
MSKSCVVSISADVVPAPDRFDWWAQLVGREVMPVSVSSEHPERFRGTCESVALPGAKVSMFDFSAMSAVRTLAHIRRHDPEDFYLFVVHEGSIGLEQRRSLTWLGAGDMAVFDTSRPLECAFREHREQGQPIRLTLMQLPRASLPLPSDKVDRLLASRFSGRAGSGALLTQYLAGLLANAAHCGPAELPRLSAVGRDLAATFLAGRLDARDALSPETRRQALLARIDVFIEHHLGDPELRPATIAAHHHVSVRLLHQLFRDRPETVGATIRRRRLERCRADLADPRLRHRTIGEIAARWGFRHPADFSRAFRAAYGAAPSEFRSGNDARMR